MEITQFRSKVKIVRFDNALEFQDYQCRQLFAEHGIHHQTTCIDRAEQNGRAERKHRNVLEMGRCLRFQAGLPKIFRGGRILTAAYIINRLPTPVLSNKLPMNSYITKKTQLPTP